MYIQNFTVNETYIPKSKPTLGKKIVFPLSIGIDPLERLLVADLKQDPDYTMLEPQVFNDPVNGKGMRILRYRKDGKVDVYWQPGVKVDRDAIQIGSGIGDFAETIIEPARFEITETGVDLHVAFTDLQKRKVELKIKENTTTNNRFSFLAPVGKDIADPKRLFLVYMHQFDFVCKNGLEFFAKIGPRGVAPQSFPILRNYKQVKFIRYSANPVIGTFNPAADKPLEFNVNSPGCVEFEGMAITINEDYKITRLSAGAKPNNAEVEFQPGFPNLCDMKDGDTESGRWTYNISGQPITGGSYSLFRMGSTVAIEINVTENWKPSGLPLSFRIFTQLVSFFRTWPTTYKWNGIITLGQNPTMFGAWERKDKNDNSAAL